MRVLLLLAALSLLAITQAAPALLVTSAARYSTLLPSSGSTYQYLYYVSNTTWTPSSLVWDCTKTADVCTSNCGQSNANGPQCAIPSLSADADPLELNTYPWQVRWGSPVPVSSGGAGTPSGFGFRGTTNQGLANVYDTFWIGEAVHFNNAIYSGTGAASWNLVITLQVTVNGNTVTQNFNYALNIDETPNRCDTNDGCPWTSSWWSANPTADTRSDCSSSSSTLPSGLKCCRFFTVNNNPCSDRLFTTDALDQTTSIVIAGRPYALNVRGFTVPGDVTTQRSYFISQERGNSKAELYANLVDACPAISSCPPGTDLVIVGTACVCQCPATATCPSNQALNSTCGCVCKSDAVNCNGGTVAQSGTTCGCDCSSVTCPGSKVVNATANCACVCPAGICNGGTVSNPNDNSCPCSCPACPVAGMVNDNRCNCACPTSAKTACEAKSGTYDLATCTCSLPCICPNSSCQTLLSCDSADGVCVYQNNTGAACDGTGNLCLAACSSTGECVFNAVDCTAQVNFTAKYGAANGQCYSIACNPLTGGCDETFLEGNDCDLDLTSQGSNAACMRSKCRTIGGASACVAEADPTTVGVSCDRSTNDQCNTAQCSAAGTCDSVPLVNQVCSDNSGCTYADGVIDPIKGTLSDVCALNASDPTRAVCYANRTVCDTLSKACNTIKCIDTVTGAYCQYTPQPFGTACDDGSKCTVNDTCQRTLQADPDTGLISWVDTGVCEGQNAECASPNPCEVGRCLEGGGCTLRSDVREDFICGVSADGCVVSRCAAGVCVAGESVCSGSSSRRGAIIGGSVAAAAAVALIAAALAFYARRRAAAENVFDPSTWDDAKMVRLENNAAFVGPNMDVNNAAFSPDN